MLAVLIFTACSNENDGDDSQSGTSSLRNEVTLSSETDGVSVLIFAKEEGKYKYLRSINSGWSAERKVSTILQLGYYKFLMFKSAGINTSFSLPSELDAEGKMKEIEFSAKPDSHGEDYVLPVDEIFFPETASVAEQEHNIDGPKTIHNKLTRAVSQVVLNINRGYADGSDMKPLPYAEGKSIMDNIASIELDIEGVGEVINIYESRGSKKTYFSATQASSTTTEGFAVFKGPFVFPSIAGEEAEVKITIHTIDSDIFPNTEKIIHGKLERNKKLEISLWMTSTYKLIDVLVDLSEITEETEGDSGIWE